MQVFLYAAAVLAGSLAAWATTTIRSDIQIIIMILCVFAAVTFAALGAILGRLPGRQ
jgi:hypothetical protein